MYFLFLKMKAETGKRNNEDDLKAVFSDYFVLGVQTSTEEEPSLRVFSLMFCLSEPSDVNRSINVALLSVCYSLLIKKKNKKTPQKTPPQTQNIEGKQSCLEKTSPDLWGKKLCTSSPPKKHLKAIENYLPPPNPD